MFLFNNSQSCQACGKEVKTEYLKNNKNQLCQDCIKKYTKEN